MTLSRDEQEIIISQNAENPHIWHVYTDYPKWQRKLEKAGAILLKTHPSGGREYELQARQITIRKLMVKKEMTESQRQAARERMKKIHQTNRGL